MALKKQNANDKMNHNYGTNNGNLKFVWLYRTDK